MFACGNCGAQVAKDAYVCPACHVGLRGIRCPNCKYVGSEQAFVNGRCPNCGTLRAASASLGWLLLLAIPISVLYSAGTGLTASNFKPILPNDASLVWALAIASAICSAVGLSFICLLRPQPDRTERRLRTKLLEMAVALLVVMVVLVGPAVWATNAISAAPDYSQEKQVVIQATPACTGHPIAGTHAYSGQSHPIVVIDTWSQAVDKGEQNDVSSHARDVGLLPNKLDSVQLVACIGPLKSALVETCTAYWPSREVSIYQADTAILLGSKTFAGSDTDPCSGDEISWSDSRIWVYIQTWVSGPVKSPASG
jgi:RNA polymerase subunit RPABC4/transcription elongation factor Spt4